MHKLFYAAVLALAGCTHSVPLPRLDAVDQRLNAERGQGSYAGVVIVRDHGRIVHQAAYGDTFAGSGIAPDAAAEWRWASVTKMLGGLMILQEVEAGRLDLDGAVAAYLPGAPPHFEHITLRQLLNFTSGLPNPARLPQEERTGHAPYFTAMTPQWDFCYGPPEVQPGERFDYNGCDSIVLGWILENVTGKSFAALLDERFKKPLGLEGLRYVTEAGDDAAVTGTVGGKLYGDAFQLHTLGAGAAVVGPPQELSVILDAYVRGGFISDHALRRAFETGVPELGYVALTAWAYNGRLGGCEEPVRIVERQGHLTGTKVLTLMAPDLGRSIVAFSNREETDWGWIWAGEGLSFELASAAFCGSVLPPA
ncbi:MAG: serine hydrolase domain-containing protein, partial [Parvularcula sp.]|jgi:CubicO group peptidase (beta-lactamase class C family)|nr:serine hydrolase domain-containing protein [Parvularcula sp.]